MEALRESFLHLTLQMSTYRRATLDEEDLVDSTSDDIYPSAPMQVRKQIPWTKNKKQVGAGTGLLWNVGKCVTVEVLHLV